MMAGRNKAERNSTKLHLEPLEIRRVMDAAGGGGLDWGDAPDLSYQTLAASNGPMHFVDPTHYLGASVDAEPDGQPTPDANGDDLNGFADEDGVVFLTPLAPGAMAVVEVTASFDGHLNAWVDFNGNGAWDLPQEQIFTSQFLFMGPNLLNFMVPAGAMPGDTFSRWRFTEGPDPLLPTGPGTATGQVLPGEVEDHPAFIETGGPRDWGDAPDFPGGPNYRTLAVNSGAFHNIDNVHFLGNEIDGEPDGQPTFGADGDDNAGTATDDEDGIRFLTPLIPGQLAHVEVTANDDGFLSAWLDSNANGVWDHPGEQIFSVDFVPAGTHVRSFIVPATAQPGDTYSRWRFTDTQMPLVPWGTGTTTGQELNGEVEDYRNTIEIPSDNERDWGDAPDFPGGPSYRTLAANTGAYHVINNVHFLGNEIDPENDGQPTINADGDDLAGPAVDDEDGVKFLTPLVPGQMADVEVTANASGFLSAWLDSNGNGIWDHPAEQIFSMQFVPVGTHMFSFMVPAGAQPGDTYSRWRFTDTQTPLVPWGTGSPAGNELNGEVEDYPNRIDEPQDFELDWGDAPDGPIGGAYNTLAINNGAFHLLDGVTYLGAEIDAELDGQPNLVATGDDVIGPAADDEDGIKFLTPLTPGQFADIEVTANVDGFLNAWVDFDGNGMWDAADQIFSAQLVPAGVSVQTFFVPAGAVAGLQTFARFRFTSTNLPIGPAGSGTLLAAALPGEVEDYEVFIDDEPVGELDWGDAPDHPNGASYQTLAANNGAHHVIDNIHFLGNEVDGEPDGQPNLAASGDDLAGPALDDEDGVRFLTPIVPGQAARVEVTANADGFLSAWMDFDRSGTWDHPAEQIFSVQFLTPGTHFLTFNVPATAKAGGTYSRWRFTDVQTPLVPFGTGVTFGAINGEVEDYRNKIIGKGDFNGDGAYTCTDIDTLVAEIASGANNPAYDLTGDLLVDTADRDAWLAEAGSANLLSQNAYLLGDANLDAAVDADDFNIWNANKFTAQAAWCKGDYTADGFIDGKDLLEWNGNKGTNVGPLTQPPASNSTASGIVTVDTGSSDAGDSDNPGSASAQPLPKHTMVGLLDSNEARTRERSEQSRIDSLFAELGDESVFDLT